MARYLLDSNAFLNFKTDPHSLRPQAREVIESRENALFVSVAGLWEMSIKAAKGKLEDFEHMIAGGSSALHNALIESGFELLPIELVHIVTAAKLPHHHGDPFDRMMIAQAAEENLTVITRDSIFSRYSEIRVMAA